MSVTLRVLVVEDSVTVRERIVETLSADPSIEVVGEATDGAVAIELCERLRPDVVTMDMMLPRMTGLSATEYIMAFCPTPILIVSASTNRGELFKTYDALAAGALDVLEKPRGTEAEGEWERGLLSAVKMIANIKVITHPRARLGRWSPALDAGGFAAPPTDAGRVIAIGASTGGPAAVLEVLRALPASFPLPILLVIHIDAPFGVALADWLSAQTDRRVVQGTDGMALPDPRSRTVVMAAPDRHMELRRGRIHLSDAPPRHSCRPSVDLLFESLARELGPAAVGCLLTGMGRDGAAGLMAIRQRGGVTIAQDEASSVVFGMPGEAVRIGAAAHVLPLGSIAEAIARLGSAPAGGRVTR